MKSSPLFFKILSTLILLLAFKLNMNAQAWTNVNALPGNARDQAMAFSLFGKGYICGGNNGTQVLKDTWEYDPVLNVWTQMADMPQKNNGASTFTAGSFGYVVGGYNFTNNELNVLWRFNPQTNNWNSKADFIGPRDNGALSWRLNNKGYFGCGWNGTNMTDDVWQYDPVADTWTQVSSFPGGPRAWVVCFSENNIGYAGLGEYPSLTPHNDFYKYDPNTNNWTACDSFPGTPRFWSLGFAVNGNGYTGCGATTTTNFLNDWWQYNIAKNKWIQVCDFDGGPLALSTAFVIGADAYMIAGRDSASNQTNHTWKFESNLLPLPLITASNAACAGDTTILTATGVSSCVWNTGDTSLSISIVATAPAVYYATSTSGNCTLTDTIHINASAPPPTPLIIGMNDTMFCSVTASYYQWYINGVPIIVDGNNYFITNLLPGTYTVYIVDSNGCDAVSLPFAFASLNENESFSCINTYMHQQVLHVANCSEYLINDFSVELFSAKGELILKKEFKQAGKELQFDLPGIKTGIYFLKISDGKNYFSRKLIATN